jgi:hypothetical protein
VSKIIVRTVGQMRARPVPNPVETVRRQTENRKLILLAEPLHRSTGPITAPATTSRQILFESFRALRICGSRPIHELSQAKFGTAASKDRERSDGRLAEQDG